ncbi:MAG TPA: oligosaccharide flippase family protein [Flavobacterium sp.]|jgi:O-antigen/teichoic acid export membrane protein
MLRKVISKVKSQEHFSNFLIYGFGQGFNLITPLLVIPYIIFICGLEKYGKAAFGMALTFFLIVFIDYGSDILGVKLIATNRHDHDKLEKVFTTTYSSKIIVLAIVLVIMSIVFTTIPYFSKDLMLYMLGLPILFGQFLNPTWFLQGVENFVQITILNILSKIIYLTGIFMFIREENDFVYINLWWGIGMIAANGISLIYILHRYRFNFTSVTLSDIKENLKNGFSIFSSQIFVSIQLYSPLILVGFIGNGLMAGMYRIVEQVVAVFKTYILLFFNFVYPRVCYLLAQDVAKGRKFWLTFNGANFIFILISMIGVFVLADPIMKYFDPKATSEVSQLLRIAVAIPLLMAVSIPLKQLVLGFDFNSFYVKWTVISVVSTVVIIILLLPVFHLKGVLFSLIMVEFLTAILFFLKIKKRLFLP